jgi:hypothetical protein
MKTLMLALISIFNDARSLRTMFNNSPTIPPRVTSMHPMSKEAQSWIWILRLRMTVTRITTASGFLVRYMYSGMVLRSLTFVARTHDLDQNRD